MKRGIILLVCTIVLLATSFAGSSLVHAASQQNPATVKPDANCQVTNVTLHGSQSPTVKCLQSHGTSKGISLLGATPADCDGAYNLIITYYTEYYGPYYMCFNGTGYLGVYIEGVTQYVSESIVDGWMRIYINGQGFVESFNGSQTFGNSVLVTQLCLQCGAPFLQ